MENRIYAIRKLFAVSLGVDVLLLCVLFALSFLLGGSSLERIVLAVFLIPSIYVFFELWSRKVIVHSQGIRLEKLLRRKELKWSEITNVGVLVLRSRTYLLLTTVKGFFSISNSYENFTNLLQDIAERIEPDKVEEEVRRQMDFHQANRFEIIKIWIAALVMLILIIFKLFY
ncbi:PH domain-containing protein [Syntrophus gentianae]|uniref:PH domain-containing protein n=1 Tax=Syntrophus gentianae TaxID=43775 RepID=A0A1H7WFN6_9BACT|nr:PH domain-containing protein [Syntrophus gentianae]SEM20311.1 PH domain-containing protein [Syntrophus gentianae]